MNKKLTFAPSEDYHVGSRNQPGSKYVFASYRLHYDPGIQELQRSAPLQLEGDKISLSNSLPEMAGLHEVIDRRRSSRDFDPEAYVSLDQLSAVLMGSYGCADGSRWGLAYKRPVPSSGNLGSPEIFLVIRRVEGVAPGLYHFGSHGHYLTRLRLGDFGDWLKQKVLFQPEHADGAAVLIITANVGRLKAKYGERGYRLALIDIGHVSQSMYLVCAALDLRVCATAGFVDREIDDALGLDGLDQATFLVVTVGR